MKISSHLYFYALALFIVMMFVYTATHFFGVLDSVYFQTYEANLTTVQHIAYPDGSYGSNYTYKHTPYYYIHRFFAYVSLIVPIILLLTLSIQSLRKQPDGKNYIKTLTLPLMYGVVNVIYFLMVTDQSLGWEYSLGLALVSVGSILVLALVAIINGILLFKKRAR